jgi:hypothetical protein
MSDERIDITINDKIDPSIPKKLADIATGATKGHSAVQRLKSELASINDTPTRKLAAATDEVTNSVNRELSAQRGVRAARDATVSSLSKEAAQRDRIAAMVDRSINRINAEAAANRALQASMNSSPRSVGSRATFDAQNAAMARQETDRLAAARQRDAAAARLQEAATEASTGAMRRNSAAAGLNRQHMLNLGFQLQDIVVGLTSGQRPLTVFLQQGAQIQGIMGQAQIGIGGLTRALWGMIAPFAPLIGAMTLFGLALKDIKDEANDQANLKEFVKTLGLTKDELKQLKDVSVTWGDTFGGVLDVLAERMGTSTDKLKKNFSDAFGSITEFAKFSVAVIYAAFVAGFRGIARIVLSLPGMVGEGMVGAVNLAIAAIEKLINVGIAGINVVADGLNSLFGTNLGRIANVSLDRMANKFAGTSKDVAAGIKGDFYGSFNDAMGLFDDIANASEKRAKDRLAKQAREIIADRNGSNKKGPKPKEDKSAERRAHALDMVNMKLDQELARMKLLKDERAIAQRMDQIEAEFAQKKIKLSADERNAILGKVTAIEQYRFVQSELDRIYEDAIEPMRSYNATLAAAKDLFDRGAISAQRYAQEVALASRKLAEANDPLFQLKEAMEQSEVSSKLYGTALQQQNYYEGIRQAMLAKGVVLSAQYVAGVNAEVDALMRRNAALAAQQQVQTTVGGIIDPLVQDQMMLQNKAAFYAAIEAFRQQDVANEQIAAQAKAQLDYMFMEKRLGYAKTFFGSLASLSSSGNKKLAAIGKAAAIAQATIDGALAVQKALASAPPPVNYALAAAAGVAAAVQVATIASTNVGSFKDGGSFMVDGRAGVDRNNINMNVSRGERVTIETPAQQRAGGSNAPSQTIVPVKIINNLDPAEVISFLESGDYDHVIVNAISRSSNEVSNIIGAGA